MTGDNVTKLPVKFRKPPDENRTLFAPWEVGKSSSCLHMSFVVDHEKAEVECATCGEKLNPMWVLVRIASRERGAAENIKRADEAMNRLEQRRRFKCDNCGKMTRVRGL